MPRLRRFWTPILYFFCSLLGLILLLFIYLVVVSRANPPKPADMSSTLWKRSEVSPGFYTLHNSWFRKSSSGLYELYVEGTPFERGVTNGKLSMELVQRQEDHFSAQINKMIPNPFYLHFLKYFVGWFNRDLDKSVQPEYREEIFGISQSASDKYGYIGSNYQRILNYHAAHDIGHALQSMALVGCTSFGTWGERSQDSTMIIGRNFDFYVGDRFAEDKIVAFFNPSSGYKFMSVTWGGFIGVVSGMNEKGLTVTINADKTKIPYGSATPVSLVVREILQYAQNIREAIQIASKRKMFVSESFLIGSALDKKAVVIEKTPDSLDVYDPQKDFIVCTNHFQSRGLAGSKPNMEQMAQSASPYRYRRLMELLDSNGKNTVAKTVGILRDRRGLHNTDIGMGNEKAINQLIAHHSIVFEPEKLLVWVSTSPWQLGRYVAYDLHKVFALAGMKTDHEINEAGLTIAEDSFLLSADYRHFQQYREFKRRLADGEEINPDSLVASNPSFYHTYVLAGDYLYRKGQFSRALGCYRQALSMEIATTGERDHISQQIKKCLKNQPSQK